MKTKFIIEENQEEHKKFKLPQDAFLKEWSCELSGKRFCDSELVFHLCECVLKNDINTYMKSNKRIMEFEPDCGCVVCDGSGVVRN